MPGCGFASNCFTEFCQHAGLECVSVLDHEACRVRPFGKLDLHEENWSDDSKLRELIRENLGVDDKEPMLVVRRARGLRPKGSRAELKWAILETLFLIERKLPHLESAIQDALQPIGTKKALGNCRSIT